jgi:hypothetical protein
MSEQSEKFRCNTCGQVSEGFWYFGRWFCCSSHQASGGLWPPHTEYELSLRPGEAPNWAKKELNYEI